MQTQIVEYRLNAIILQMLDQRRALLQVRTNQVEHMGIVGGVGGDRRKAIRRWGY